MTVNLKPKFLAPGTFQCSFQFSSCSSYRVVVDCLNRTTRLIGRLTIVSAGHSSKDHHTGKKLCFMSIKRMPLPFSTFNA